MILIKIHLCRLSEVGIVFVIVCGVFVGKDNEGPLQKLFYLIWSDGISEFGLAGRGRCNRRNSLSRVDMRTAVNSISFCGQKINVLLLIYNISSKKLRQQHLRFMGFELLRENKCIFAYLILCLKVYWLKFNF